MRLPRVVRAFLSAAWFFVRRHPLATFLIVWVLATVYVVVLVPQPPPETPQQQQARVAAENDREAQRKAEKQQTKALCAWKSRCEKYAQARQECAVAGDFKNCLRVKMGSDDYPLSVSCTDDGKLDDVPESEMPGPVACFTSGL
jgi:hypothetical protein